jgi:hypothetical protein
MVEVPEFYWVSKRLRNNMVVISMHLLNKKDENKEIGILDGGGVVFMHE